MVVQSISDDSDFNIKKIYQAKIKKFLIIDYIFYFVIKEGSAQEKNTNYKVVVTFLDMQVPNMSSNRRFWNSLRDSKIFTS